MNATNPASGTEQPHSGFNSLIADARRGDGKAVSGLFLELQPRLLRYLRSQDPDIADDVAAEVWLVVARGLSSFDGDWDDFRAWFFSVARRRLADHRRKAARHRSEPVADSAFERLAARDSPELDAVERLSGQETATWLASVLSTDQTEVLLLRVLAGLDVDQVAELMGRSANWVRVTQHRALRCLERRLRTVVQATR